MPDTGIGVVITGKDIYDLVLTTKESVTRIESRLGSVNEALENHERSIQDHTSKLEELQKFRYQTVGWGSAAGAIAGFLVPYLVKLIFGG